MKRPHLGAAFLFLRAASAHLSRLRLRGRRGGARSAPDQAARILVEIGQDAVGRLQRALEARRHLADLLGAARGHAVDAGGDLGRGSPVGVEFYTSYAYPSEFFDNLFEADWSRGRLLYTALTPSGATYAARSDRAEFVSRTQLAGNWILLGRDVALERTILADIQHRLATQPGPQPALMMPQ